MSTPKPQRLTAEQTRDSLLDAAIEQLDIHGVPPILDHVSLEDTIKLSGVPRSSGYSAWEKVSDGRTPQQAFRRALLRRLTIADGIGMREMDPLEAAIPVALSRIEGLNPQEQRRELVRITAGAQFLDAFERPGYRAWLALNAATTSAPPDETDEEVLGWLRQTEAALVETMIDVFKGMAALLGMQPAPGMDPDLVWPMFTSAVIGLGEGLFGRMRTSNPDYLVNIPGPGPNGTTEMWTLYALVLDAAVERFFVMPTDTTAH